MITNGEESFQRELPWVQRFCDSVDDNRLDLVEEKLWLKARKFMNTTPFDEVRAILIGFSDIQLHLMRSHLRNIGVNLIAFMPRLRSSVGTSPLDNIFTHAFINIDSFDDLEDGVDALLSSREKSKGMVTILLSRKVSGDDLEVSRTPICDATLKLPLSDERLRQGIIWGTENNRRQFDLSPNS